MRNPMPRGFRPASVLTAIAVGAVFAACGGGGSSPTSPGGTTPPPNPPAGTGNTISVAGTTFDPSAVTIAVGGSVTWVFGGITHNVIFGGTGAPTNIPDTSTGSVSRTFNTKGTFSMTCTHHTGMTGTITVQ